MSKESQSFLVTLHDVQEFCQRLVPTTELWDWRVLVLILGYFCLKIGTIESTALGKILMPIVESVETTVSGT